MDKIIDIKSKRLCSANKLKEEIRNIVRFAAYNGFPRWTAKKIVNESLNPRRRTDEAKETVETVYMFLPYFGKEAETVVLRCKRRLMKLFKKDQKVELRVHFKTTKMSFFTSNKDKTPYLSSSSVVYQFSCPGCMDSYIGKTESTLHNRTKEHGTDPTSAINKHFQRCSAWQHIVGLFAMNDSEVNLKQLQVSAVRENTKVIKKTDNWLKLAFLESLAIKEHRPELNKGIKSCKDLVLF